ncbi:MAG: PspC domain-containing protein [Micrococcales bacterium]|nr:PspC domain-containing protein [Micrococcales bacterium]
MAAGIAAHMNMPVKLVRWLFVITALFGGSGLVLYLFFWVSVPSGECQAGNPATQRLAPRLRLSVNGRPQLLLGAGLALVAVATIMFLSLRGYGVPINWLWPSVVFLAAVALAWSQLGRIDVSRTSRRISVLRLVGALILVVVAIALLINQGQEPTALLAAVGAGMGLLLGVALVLAPWLLRLIRALGEERSARARESERADIAAHLHDSVLQTLAVIRARADQADQVRRLARAQERELRTWLYQDRERAGTSLAELLGEVAGEVEDTTGLEIGVVLVGDCPPNPALQALVGATREALLNAARHGAPPVSLYGELNQDPVNVFVRDRGEGFDIGQIPSDRLGVRESIMGRMDRNGGQVTIASGPGRGTEIHLAMSQTREANGV